MGKKPIDSHEYVKRQGSTSAKITVSNFEELKQQFSIDVKAVIEFEEIPAGLLIN